MELRRVAFIGLVIGPGLAWIDVLLGTVPPAAGRVEPAVLFAELTAGAVAFMLLYAAGALVCVTLSRFMRFSRERMIAWLVCLLGAAVCLQVLRRFFEISLETGSIAPQTIAPVVAIAVLVLCGRSLTRSLLRVDLSRRPRRLILWSPAMAILLGSLTLLPPRPAAAAQAPAVQLQPRYVLLLTVDTLRADALRTYAPTAPPTPAISTLAGDSVVFERAISSAPWTLTAFASILTGLSPDVHQTLTFASRVPDACPTLAEHLRDAGYRTAAIGHNPFLNPAYNLHRGFGQYTMFPRQRNGSIGAQVLSDLFPARFSPQVGTTGLTDMALGWLERNAERPFFLWLHYFDPHLPYEPPDEYLPQRRPPTGMGARVEQEMLLSVRQGYFVPTREDVAWVRGLYDGEVRHVDANIGRVIARLKSLGIYDQTLIVFTSDHGEEFWEHGRFEHGHSVYEELLHVPLLVKLPGSSRTARVARPVTTTSVTPTMLDLCGIPFDADALSARSLRPALQRASGGATAPDQCDPLVSTGCAYYENQVAIRVGDLKYIRRLLSGREELYDLSADPGERISLMANRPDAIEECSRLLDRHRARCAELRERYGIARQADADLSEALLQDLRSLGYAE
jgi:choline-sulfatase